MKGLAHSGQGTVIPSEGHGAAVVDYAPWSAEWFGNAADWVVMGAVQNDDVLAMDHQPAICTLSDWVSGKEARLIAAAPDLLEALNAVRRSTEWSCMEAETQEAVTAAIDKATAQ